jgi:phosphoglycolate phosphatase
MPFSLVIFDLDGTLVDSFPWFRRHLNGVADRFGFRRVEDSEVAGLRHADTREILSQLEVPRWKLPAIVRHMRALKASHLQEIALFDGAASMLRALKGAGLELALVSSDSEANARAQLGDLAALFSYYDCGASLFGKATKFRRVIRAAGLAPAEALAIGDETRDIAAAREAGIACAAVCWGYAAPDFLRAKNPDLIFESMDEIVPALSPKLAQS